MLQRKLFAGSCLIATAVMLSASLCALLPNHATQASEETQQKSSEVSSDGSKPDGPKVVFLIGEEGYKTAETLPQFAREELEPRGFRSTVVTASQDDPNSFPGIEAINDADLVVLSVRRKALPTGQLDLLKKYLAAGKPLLAIRTSSHGFALSQGEPPEGHAVWPDFDQEVLGYQYAGDFNNKGGTDVTTQLRAEKHPLMAGIKMRAFHSDGSLYKSFDLRPQAQVLLQGFATEEGKPIQMPVAWTYQYNKSRVFYTSLGHPSDFKQRQFRHVLLNACYWCLNRPAPTDGASGTEAASRDRFKLDVAANEKVEEMSKNFAGKGEVGDDSEPTPPEEAVKLFKTYSGLEMKIVATEPTVRQPLNMNWDSRGRLWVVQYLQYPFPAGLKVVKYDQYLRAVFDKVPAAPPNHVPGQDKITVLEDTDGDGTFDQAKDVITGLNIVSSVAPGHGGIWVLNPPYLLCYPDKNRDDIPDGDPEVHLRGFGLEDTHSVANSIKWGPDGWLYGANGSTTTGTVSSAVSKNVSFKGQNIWRYHPETKVFELYAEGGGNTFSVEFDKKGRVFSGSNHGNTRGMHYAQGEYATKSWGKHGPLTNPYAFGYFEHMRHKGQTERFTQAFAIYEGGTFPPEFNGAIIAANSLHNRVWASRLFHDTSTYQTEDIAPLVLTPDRWFRPVDCKLGPDGAVYLADWYDSRLTHVDPRDNWHKSSGRLYRLQPTDYQPLKPFDLVTKSNDELLQTLDHPNRWFRQQAVQVLGERNDPTLLPQLQEIALSQTDSRALEALWTINLCVGLSDELAIPLLNHTDPNLRRWTIRLIGDRREASPSVAASLAELARVEPDAEVRSQLASSAKRLPAEHCLPIVRNLLARDEDLTDLHIPLLLWWAIESKTVSDRDAVLAFFGEEAVWKLPMVQQTVTERLMQRYAMAGGEANLDTCAQLLTLAPDAASKKLLMVGMQQAFRGRKITGLPDSLAKALDEYQKTLGESELALALRLGNQDAIKRATAMIADSQVDPDVRLLYIEILGEIKAPQAVRPLLGLLSEQGPQAYAIKRVALQALMNFDQPEIGPTIVGRMHSSLPPENDVRETAMRVVASRAEWAIPFLEQIDTWKLKKEWVPADVVQQLALHQDKTVQALVKKHWGKIRGGTPAEKQKEMDRVAALLKEGTGNPDRGKELFKKTCAVCHELFGEGGSAGPKLTGYERDNLNFMLLAIVDPSAAIREEYTTMLVVTTDGRTITGLIEDQDTRTLTLRDVKAQKTLINKEDIDILKALDVSLMPENQTKQMSDQEVRDLFAYLMSRTPRKALEAAAGAGE